ncbi:MAG: DUF3122 domain-containing protein [Leptolyngbya sp. SIO1E4]|nr:DUF3122 domain-containing protein [Leptolyngbya sp. SIO1E4]
MKRLRAIALLFSLITVLVLLFPFPAQATIRQLEEAPGQILYQTRAALQDQQGNRWQAIAFKRQPREGAEILSLRLVGFPGAAVIDRDQPLKLLDSLGRTFTAPDASAKLFTDETAPEPHIGQYDLKTVLKDLQPEIPLEIQMPVQDGEPIQLVVAPSILQEWQQLLDH